MIRNQQKPLLLIFAVLVVCSLGGCGQKGSLYLPDESAFAEFGEP